MCNMYLLLFQYVFNVLISDCIPFNEVSCTFVLNFLSLSATWQESYNLSMTCLNDSSCYDEY